ncbi:kinase-like protein [Plenodomus tracheiphilus IPT5]|uniref:EKC/KEOPS complex subunit BUD32 n=1 Tax=Plenodomus tracheiphilus IPT5 TaxID=1408161 RepID=A0A6A7B8G7_9PLEO|nr:kinase-like protein [Plenodomus tracheiphilus IPT5]
MTEPIISAPPPPTSLPLHTLPPPFTSTATSLIPLTQGAEALVYKTTFLSPTTPAVLKYRPPKPYRHPTLDRRLTKQRLLAEARSLIRVKRGGVNVPGVLGADWEAGWLVLEFIEGGSLRGVLNGWAESRGARANEEGGGGLVGVDKGDEEGILDLMRRVGREIGKLHDLGVCHGDLTTSNIMVRRRASAVETKDNNYNNHISDDEDNNTQPQPQPQSIAPRGKQTPSTLRESAISATEPTSPPLPSNISTTTATPTPQQHFHGSIYLIDFGLTTSSIQDEDKAVDLYVLERAFSATHPAADHLFQELLAEYGRYYKGGRGVLRRLEGVRGRGRKRSMLG